MASSSHCDTEQFKRSLIPNTAQVETRQVEPGEVPWISKILYIVSIPLIVVKGCLLQGVVFRLLFAYGSTTDQAWQHIFFTLQALKESDLYTDTLQALKQFELYNDTQQVLLKFDVHNDTLQALMKFNVHSDTLQALTEFNLYNDTLQALKDFIMTPCTP